MTDFSTMPSEQADLERFDAELARLGRGAGALRLRLGEALEALARMGGHHELGFSSLWAYALERCERGGRWATDSRALARRLMELPRLRAALMTGELSWSMTELVAPHASASNEHALVDEARSSTVRALRSRLGGHELPCERRTLRVTVPRADAWALEFTRLLMQEVSGSRSADSFIEAMLAEGFTTLQTVAPESAHVELAAETENTELAEWRAEAEADCEGRVERRVTPDSAEARAAAARAAETPLPWTPLALDAEIRRLCAELATRDLTIGELFERLRRADGWRRLGWATEEQYARERVGVSYSSLKGRLTLARRSRKLAAIGSALRSGRVGYEAAQLVARVADRHTVEAWLARAEERTIKHLREEVDAVEMFARTTGNVSVLAPPDKATMEAYAEMERYVLSGAGTVHDSAPAIAGGAARDSQISGSQISGSEARGQISGGRLRPGAGSVSLRFDLREDLAQFWRELEERFRRSGLPGSFVEFLCLASWRSWAHPLDSKGAYGHIYRRDCFRCMSPVCMRRDLTPHHLQFRSRGGSDDDENIASPCLWCHLEGIHAGRIKAEPPASNVRWTFGRTPILIVEGRKRIRLDSAATR